MDTLESCFIKNVNRHFNQHSSNSGTAGTGFNTFDVVYPDDMFTEDAVSKNVGKLMLDESTADNSLIGNNSDISLYATCMATAQSNLLLRTHNSNKLKHCIVTNLVYTDFNDFTVSKKHNNIHVKSEIRLILENKNQRSGSADDFEYVNNYLSDSSMADNNYIPDLFNQALSPDSFESDNEVYYFVSSKNYNNFNFDFSPRVIMSF